MMSAFRGSRMSINVALKIADYEIRFRNLLVKYLIMHVTNEYYV